MQRPGDQPPAVSENSHVLQVEARNGLTALAEAQTVVHGVERLFLTLTPCTLNRADFRNSTHVLS